MPGRTANVRYWGEIGLNADIGIRAAFDPIAVLRLARHPPSGCKCGVYPLAYPRQFDILQIGPRSQAAECNWNN